MKKLLLSFLLLFLVCNSSFADMFTPEKIKVGNNQFASNNSFRTSMGGTAYVITDKFCGQQYLVVTERFSGHTSGRTIAVTPLIKSAVYVHKK